MSLTSFDDLINASCRQLTGSLTRLDNAEALELSLILVGWSLPEDRLSVSRDYKFDNYFQTMSFVNAAAWIAHQEDHHADMLVTYNHCKITYSTHSVKGLSLNDFICAAKINNLF